MGAWFREVESKLRPIMTRERAEFVRELRRDGENEPGHSWRAIADRCAEEWGPPIIRGHQIHGQALCWLSAELLGENPNEEPWN